MTEDVSASELDYVQVDRALIERARAHTLGPFVTYPPEQKCAALELDPLLIEQHGPVSAEVADAMARRCSRILPGGP